MGCFDSNCCLTGLPLHHGDPVRAGLLVPTGEYSFVCYAGSSYQFWTLPVKSTYNDYGDIERNDASDEEWAVVELLLKSSLPALEDHVEYSRKVFETTPKNKIKTEDLWEACWRGDIELDPYREEGKVSRQEARFRGIYVNQNKPAILCPWMCHDWAWDALLKIGGSERLKKGVELFCSNILNDSVYGSYDESIAAFVDGGRSGISTNMARLLADKSDFAEIRDTFAKMLLETATVVLNMHKIRKHLIPMTTVGEQYEQFEYLPNWTRLVAKKTTEMKRRND